MQATANSSDRRLAGTTPVSNGDVMALGHFTTHASRTLMLADINLLLTALPLDTPSAAYRDAIIDDNLLGKRTWATRHKALRHLRELYHLDPAIPSFHALRALWNGDGRNGDDVRPLLAILCAFSQDAILRATAEAIVSLPPGVSIRADALEPTVEAAFPDQYNRTTLARMARNCASTWTQAGHLRGHLHKTRAIVRPGTAPLAYALLQGHLHGLRGEALFTSPWLALLDLPLAARHGRAQEAARQGYLEYRSAGGMLEISFRSLLPNVSEFAESQQQ